MTKKQRDELNQARLKEFEIDQSDDEKTRKALREMHHFLDVMEEEGWSRMEAIVFLANSCRPR